MYFKNLRLYKLNEEIKLDANILSEALQKYRAAKLGSHDSEGFGFISPVEHASHGLVHAVDGHYLVCLEHSKKVLPTAVINEVADEKAIEIERQQGYRPGRKQMKEIKENVVMELLPKAFSVSSKIYAWINKNENLLAIDTGSESKAGHFLESLAKCIEPFPVEPLHLAISPTTAMTQWISNQEAPNQFTLDQGAEFKAFNETKASVTYKKQDVDIEDVEKNLSEGKSCTSLNLTFDDKLSFKLDENFTFKAIKVLDVIKENTTGENSEEVFDSEFTLMAGEYTALILALIDDIGLDKRD